MAAMTGDEAANFKLEKMAKGLFLDVASGFGLAGRTSGVVSSSTRKGGFFRGLFQTISRADRSSDTLDGLGPNARGEAQKVELRAFSR